jgi:hypothetical protein
VLQIQESHENLRIEGVMKIRCCYAHVEERNSFTRRLYWLVDDPWIVLAHYRDDTPGEAHRLQRLHTAALIAPTMALRDHAGAAPAAAAAAAAMSLQGYNESISEGQSSQYEEPSFPYSTAPSRSDMMQRTPTPDQQLCCLFCSLITAFFA